MRNAIVLTLALITGLLSIQLQAKTSAFPGREKFPELPFIELDKLYKMRADVVIVDARSSYEYKTLRIKDSLNIPVANDSFEQSVKDLRSKTAKPIIFYCNGRTCMKSFHATKKSIAAGVKDVYAYDAGIFEWAVAHPDLAVLLGKSPVNASQLIAKKSFKARLLNPDKFSEQAIDMGQDSMVLDVRDKYQRLGIGFYPGKERWVSLDNEEKLEKYLLKAKQKNKTVFIYDEVGKQVQWLQYSLEKHGIKNYFFMEKGAHAYYASISDWKK